MKQKSLLSSAADRRRQSGQAAVELAITLPLVMALVFGALAVVGWYYSQSVAAVSAASAARAAAIGRGDLALGQQENERLLAGNLGESGGALAGQAQVSVDPLRRAILVRTQAAPSIFIPFLGTYTFEIFSGSFTRNWQFWAGPPDAWD